MLILGKLELFRKTFLPTPIYYDHPSLSFFKNFPTLPTIKPHPPTITVGRVGASEICAELFVDECCNMKIGDRVLLEVIAEWFSPLLQLCGFENGQWCQKCIISQFSSSVNVNNTVFGSRNWEEGGGRGSSYSYLYFGCSAYSKLVFYIIGNFLTGFLKYTCRQIWKSDLWWIFTSSKYTTRG